MLSREKGHSVATRPATEAEVGEIDDGAVADGSRRKVARDPARRSAVKTSARTRRELPLRLEARSGEWRMRVALEGVIWVTVGGRGRNIEARI